MKKKIARTTPTPVAGLTGNVRLIWRGLSRQTRTLTVAAALALLGMTALSASMLVVGDLVSDSYAQVESEIRAEIGGWRYVSLSVDDTAMQLNSGATSGTASTITTVTVETSVSSGATLYLSMAGETNDLFWADNSSYSIKATTTTNSAELSNIDSNSWGYAIYSDSQLSNYAAVPTSNESPAILGQNLAIEGSESVTVYYGMNLDGSLPAGEYSNSLLYTAVVESGYIRGTTISSIVANGTTITDGQLIANQTNTITFTTSLQTNVYGVPRVYMTYGNENVECTNVSVTNDSSNNNYMQITCDLVPPAAAAEETEVSFTITARGDTDDPFCDESIRGTTSDCEAGNWQWGTETISGGYSVRLLFGGITTMQAMDTDICNAAQEGETTQLTDTRDGKTYWVAKLKDGNCWMTQNLDFDLDSTTELNSSTSDVDTTTTLSGASLYTSLADGCFSSSCTNGYNVIQTWDLGEYVITNPTDSTSCTTTTDLSTCADGSGNDRFASVSDSTTYDAHYLIGNYYSWGAATAGSASTATSSGSVATSSICPKNWKLPLSSSTYDDTSGSFYYLLDGLTSVSTITSAPYYFVRGGYVTSNGLSYAGNYGYSWSRVANSSLYAYDLYFVSSSYVNPSRNSGRYYGFSVRCVAV